MNFHPDKCKVLPITNKKGQIPEYDNPLPFHEFWHEINGNVLEYVTEEKDLGVIITRRLSWIHHCEALLSRANRQLGLLRRTCYFIIDSKRRRALYLSLVRSIFEHCCQVWAPQARKSKDALEALQKRAVKWILREQHLRYPDRDYMQKLCNLDLLPMESKFIFSDLVLFFKIISETVSIKLPGYVSKVEPSHVKRVTRSTSSIAAGMDNCTYKCNIMPTVNAFKDSYFYRTVKQWNSLPIELRSLENIEHFKTNLKEHLWLGLGVKPN